MLRPPDCARATFRRWYGKGLDRNGAPVATAATGDWDDSASHVVEPKLQVVEAVGLVVQLLYASHRQSRDTGVATVERLLGYPGKLFAQPLQLVGERYRRLLELAIVARLGEVAQQDRVG